MQTMEAPTATKVIYGVNELDLDLAGKSVRGIWKVLEQVLNIPRDAQVSVNGSRVDDDYVVRPGDEIEFQKQAGVKGISGLTRQPSERVPGAGGVSRAGSGPARKELDPTCSPARSCASRAISSAW